VSSPCRALWPLSALPLLFVGCAPSPSPAAAQSAAALVALAERGHAAAGQWRSVLDCLAAPQLTDLAIWTLGELGPGAIDALPALLALPVADQPLREAAVCIAVGRLGAGDPRATAWLRDRLRSQHVIVRQAARGALL